MKKLKLSIIIFFIFLSFAHAENLKSLIAPEVQPDPYYQFQKGLAYILGKGGVHQDNKLAAKWIRKAADQGFSDAQYFLGQFYTSATGVEKDYFKAAKWFRKAADQGQPLAQMHLGLFYANGYGGIKQDYYEAEKWFRKSAEQGESDAQFELGMLYANRQDYYEASKWFEKSAKQGNSVAKRNLKIATARYNIENKKESTSGLTEVALGIAALAIGAYALSDDNSSKNNSSQTTEGNNTEYNACTNRIVSCRVSVGSCDMVGNCDYNRYCDSNTGLFNGDCDRSQYKRNYYCDPETRKQNIEFDRLVNRVCSK